jgi:putative transposase
MSSHLYLIARAISRQILPDILRDLKKYTAKAIIQQIENEPESRKEWLLARFKNNGKYLKRIENYKFWHDGNHAEIIFSNNFFYQKLDYIHKNPVEEMIVSNPEDYYFSSARNYAGMDSILPVVLETKKLRTY